jgi:hypothetical protein
MKSGLASPATRLFSASGAINMSNARKGKKAANSSRHESRAFLIAEK